MYGYGYSPFIKSASSSGGTPVDPDAQAFITAAAITDPTQQSAINTLVTDLKGYGVWTKMKALYPFVGNTASQHKWNLKDPRDLDAAYRLVFNGGWVHSAQGALPNGVNAFADAFITNSAMSYTSTHLSTYSRTDANNSGIAMGNTTNQYCMFYTRNSGNFQMGINAAAFNSVANANSLGHYIATRTASNAQKGYKNGLAITTSTNAVANDNTKMYIGAAFRTGVGALGYDNRQTAFASIGDGLTDSEAANFYTAVQTFQVTLGRSIGTQTVSDADAQAFVTNAGIVDQVEADAVNNLVIGLKADGLWSKMKALYPFVGGTASSHKFNLKDPRHLDAAFRLVFNGGWTHSATGAKPNGTNAFAESYFTPNTEMGTNQQIAYYIGDNIAGNMIDVGSAGGTDMGLWTRHASLGYVFDFPSGSVDRVTFSNSDSRGNYLVFNNSTLGRGVYKGGSSIHSSSFVNKNIVDVPLRTLHLSKSVYGFYSQRELRLVAFATGFNSLTEVTNFQTAIQAFNTTLNRQV